MEKKRVWLRRTTGVLAVGVLALATNTAHAALQEPGGRVEPMIVGGALAQQGEFAWMVWIKDFKGGCGGALLTKHIVLTAAHCIYQKTGPTTDIALVAGVVDRQSPYAINVKSTFVHRAAAFDLQTMASDWALVKLERELDLPTLPIAKDAALNNGEFTVIGWGLIDENASDPERFQRKAQVPFVPDGQCGAAYRAIGEPFLDDHHLCAGDLKNGGVDTCSHDSGGPMVRRAANNQFVQVGITSFGKGCARPGFPGVYTEVTRFATEIEQAAAAMP